MTTMVATMNDTEAPTLTDTCARCGRVETFRYPDDPDYWTLGPDNWLLLCVDWAGYLASWDHDRHTYGRDLVVLHVCPSCVTEEDQDEPHMSWRLRSGAAVFVAD